MIASALFLVVAAVFLWRNNLSTAFVIAALGACSWFLSYRAQMRSKIVDDDESSEETEDEVSTGSDSDRVERQDEN